MGKLLNSILKFLLAGWEWKDGKRVPDPSNLLPTDENFWPKDFTWLAQLFGVINPILYAIMAVVGAAGAIYAIILGVNLAKAEDTSKRDEAKKHLITVLIAVGVTIAFVLFFNLLMPKIILAFM